MSEHATRVRRHAQDRTTHTSAVLCDDAQQADFTFHRFTPGSGRLGILQVLIHGNSYDHRYWDADPVNGHEYSFVDHMVGLGYDVLAVDLPGAGPGRRPDADGIGFAHLGEALSSAVARFRAELGASTKVALIGHSLGTILAVYTQAWWPVADAVVGTGVGFSSSLLPSPYGSGVRERLLLEPYADWPSDLRRQSFYYEPNADPAMIEYDNDVLKTALPRRVWAESIAVRNDRDRAGLGRITCPVFIQLGEFDPVLPGEFAETERNFWPHDVEVTVEQLDGAGHCFNLHRNPQHGWNRIDAFLRAALR